jgi:hypothetical protein
MVDREKTVIEVHRADLAVRCVDGRVKAQRRFQPYRLLKEERVFRTTVA